VNKNLKVFKKWFLFLAAVLLIIFAFTACAGDLPEIPREELLGTEPGIETPVEEDNPQNTEAVSATVSGQVVDSVSGDFLSCFVNVKSETIKTTNYITDIVGRFSFRLEIGIYEIKFFRDVEYEIKEITVEIKNRLPQKFAPLKLTKLYDVRSLDYRSVDLHQHSTFSDGIDPPVDVYMANLAAGLDYGVLSDHNTVDGQKEWQEIKHKNFLAVNGIEVTSDAKGHFNVINTDKLYNWRITTPDAMKASVESAKSDSTFVQINHPSRYDILGLAYWELIDCFEGIEVWNGKDVVPTQGGSNKNAKDKWYELLSQGIRLTATAGADNHQINAPSFTGTPRTYVTVDEFTVDAMIKALKAGRCFISNGPVIEAKINGKSFGETVSPGGYTLGLKAFSNEKLTKITILKNGEPIKTVSADQLVCADNYAVTLSAGDFITIEVEAVNGGFALCNPIFCE